MFHKIWLVFLCCCCCLLNVRTVEQLPRIIIVGSGAAGIAAASRLFQYGFKNVTILEAENRIGGRVYTEKFGDYWVDLGGQWVHGEEDNVSYELAWGLGLLEHWTGPGLSKFFSSSGPTVPEDCGNQIMDVFFNITGSKVPDEYSSVGQFYTQRLNEYFDNHTEINADLRESLMRMFDLIEMAEYAGKNWFDVIVDQEYISCKGDQEMNWKDKGYSTILDILMKKIPDPTEELPVLNNTILNTEVTRINYNISSGIVHVVTANGNVYLADHVIVTASVGVLKSDHQTLFNPPLPEQKINAIDGIELGSVAKIYLLYSNPWWIEPDNEASPNYFFNFHWTNADRNEYASDPEKSWMLSIGMVTIVEHKSRLLSCWLSGPFAREMENIPTNRVFEQLKELFHRFFGRNYNVSEPVAMLRSNWFTNKHFRGTWSHRSRRTARLGARTIDLERPILTTNGEPLVQFAGEATHEKHPSTVHGAIQSGWREAKRLTQFYAGRRFLAEASDAGKEFWRNFDGENPILTTRLVSNSWRSVVTKKLKSKRN